MPEQVLATSAPDPWISEILTLLLLKKDASITFFVTNGFFWHILSHIAPFQDKVELRPNWQSLAYAVIARKAGKVGDGIGLGGGRSHNTRNSSYTRRLLRRYWVTIMMTNAHYGKLT